MGTIFSADPVAARIAAEQSGVCLNCGTPAQTLGLRTLGSVPFGVGGIGAPFMGGVTGLGGIANPYFNVNPWNTIAQINALQTLAQLQNSGIVPNAFGFNGLGTVSTPAGIFSRI